MYRFVGEIKLTRVEYLVIEECIHRSTCALLFIGKRFRVCSLPGTPTLFCNGYWKDIFSKLPLRPAITGSQAKFSRTMIGALVLGRRAAKKGERDAYS